MANIIMGIKMRLTVIVMGFLLFATALFAQNINFTLPAGTKVFYVNLIDSAGNTVSTNVINIGDTNSYAEKPLPVNRIQFNPVVWNTPKIYAAVSDSLNYPNEKAIYYEGLDYRGHKTKVFAYIGFPSGASDGNKVPAVVLVHGGGGTAFPQWVKIWTDKGYAAIAMDLEGHQPSIPETQLLAEHDLAGPKNTLLADINNKFEDQWLYHAVADVYLAHSLLASDKRVDENRIGITGISWGGIIASIAIGNADCFAFAVPVYGCGYLNKSKGMYKNIYTDQAAKLWDASNWLHKVKTPTLWINSDSDDIFSIDATTKSAQAVNNSITVIIPHFPHSHVDGWAPREIYSFANSIVKEGKKLITIVKHPSCDDLSIEIDTRNSYGYSAAILMYSLDSLTYDTNNKLTNIWLQKPL
jgi:cephalosporin-C deacetylase-like acetyl esterase